MVAGAREGDITSKEASRVTRAQRVMNRLVGHSVRVIVKKRTIIRMQQGSGA